MSAFVASVAAGDFCRAATFSVPLAPADRALPASSASFGSSLVSAASRTDFAKLSKAATVPPAAVALFLNSSKARLIRRSLLGRSLDRRDQLRQFLVSLGQRRFATFDHRPRRRGKDLDHLGFLLNRLFFLTRGQDPSWPTDGEDGRPFQPEDFSSTASSRSRRTPQALFGCPRSAPRQPANFLRRLFVACLGKIKRRPRGGWSRLFSPFFGALHEGFSGAGRRSVSIPLIVRKVRASAASAGIHSSRSFGRPHQALREKDQWCLSPALEGLANWRGEKAAIGRAENVDYITTSPSCRPHNSGQPGKKERTPFAAPVAAAVGQRTKDLLGQETLLLSRVPC